MKHLRMPSSPTGGKENLHEVDAPRTHYVSVRLSEAEYALLDGMCDELCCTPSAAIRMLLWQKEV